MVHLDIFQTNNLIIGNRLAAEIASSSSELRAFVVTGAYTYTGSRPKKPTKYLNKSQDDLLFWIRRYEVEKNKIEEDITHEDLIEAIYVRDIRSIAELETELEKYIDDFSLMKPDWYIDNPL